MYMQGLLQSCLNSVAQDEREECATFSKGVFPSQNQWSNALDIAQEV